MKMQRHPKIDRTIGEWYPGPLRIRTGTPADQLAVEHLQRTWSNAVGFIPRTGISDRIERNQVWMIDLNDDAAGYLVHAGGIRQPRIRLSQIALDPQLLRAGLGTHLLDALRTQYDWLPVIADIRERLPLIPMATATGATRISTNNAPTARGLPVHRYRWPKLR